MERRHLLRTTGIALAAGLAGCTDQGSTGGNGDGETTETDDGMDGETTETDDGMDGETTETPTEGESAAEISGAQVIINNVGVSAWEVTEDETGSVAETGAENPTLTLEVGQRYAVTNNGWATHPFELQSGETALLSQGNGVDGEFEADADVGWVDEGGQFSFTFTQDLADRADSYRCTVHPSMEGSVESA